MGLLPKARDLQLKLFIAQINNFELQTIYAFKFCILMYFNIVQPLV